jgi:hypothetical protein
VVVDVTTNSESAKTWRSFFMMYKLIIESRGFGRKKYGSDINRLLFTLKIKLTLF